jgi:hypothetical protein
MSGRLTIQGTPTKQVEEKTKTKVEVEVEESTASFS